MSKKKAPFFESCAENVRVQIIATILRLHSQAENGWTFSP